MTRAGHLPMYVSGQAWKKPDTHMEGSPKF